MQDLIKLSKNFSAVIFDFDGVVADTEKLHFEAWNKGFSYLNGSLTDEEYLPLKSTGRNHIVNTFAKKLGREITSDEALEICRIKDEYFVELCRKANKSLLINGVREYISELKAMGKKIAVASSASTTTEMLKKVELENVFDVVVDGNMKLPKKPEPDAFLMASELLYISPENCLVFEDSPAGAEAAINAEINFICVGGLKHPKALLEIIDFS